MHIKPKNKAITAYYQALAAYQQQGMTHEMAVRQAFASLLDALAKPAKWTLILEYTLPNRKRIDGALFDEFKIARGYWEAKDTADNLEAEIHKKQDLGYPLANTIFEDTRKGILYQNGQRVMEATLTHPTELAALLTLFFTYTEPHIEEFHTAVATFQERIPELAHALMQRIAEEHRTNTRFVTALDTFYALCQQSLNPNLSRHAINDMVVQHLLTERLFRTIFNNPDFTRRNVIAAEIETVIDALTSRSFSRQDFLNKLDYFYLAIEQAATTISAFSEKQHFLNTVYERFFQGFSHKQADTHGIVYTPQEIVDFMCASVEAVLQRDFDTSLSSASVLILDPCVGTGNFIVNIVHRINRQMLPHKYCHELFCNEVMLLPYYIASLNIEHAYYERTGEYLPFEGMSFVDTLDMDRPQQTTLFNQPNTMRVERQKQADITVIIGNPPYNMGQLNANDNNKNRQYELVDQRVRDTYTKDSKATNRRALSDMYVRFFRWATDRLQGRDGIVCFVSNNGFLDGIAFDGFRKHLADDFTHIYHLDLGGNARRGGGGSVFDIRVGVGITVLVRKTNSGAPVISYYRVPDEWRKEQKVAFLAEHRSIETIPWEPIHPDTNHTWLTQGLRAEFATFIPIGTRDAKAGRTTHTHTLFQTFSLGVSTNRDSIAYDFDKTTLATRVEAFIEAYTMEVFRWVHTGKPADVDNFVKYDTVKWSRNLKRDLCNERFVRFDTNAIRTALYRPFTKKWLYDADTVIDERGQTGKMFFPTPATEAENVAICLTDLGAEKPFMTMVTQHIPDLHLVGPGCGTQTFPFYTYDEDGSNRRENITDEALAHFQQHYGAELEQAQLPSTWDVFCYTYALLHHPTYRERYANNLRRELPRIPLLGDSATLHTLVDVGRRLVQLHLDYEQVTEYPLQWVEKRGVPRTMRVEKMRLTRNKDAVVVNDALTLTGIPAGCFDYRLGNRSALEWVLDQYQVKTDTRSDITSDPNRDDDPEYIARLVGRIVTVSVETVSLVAQVAAVHV